MLSSKRGAATAGDGGCHAALVSVLQPYRLHRSALELPRTYRGRAPYPQGPQAAANSSSENTVGSGGSQRSRVPERKRGCENEGALSYRLANPFRSTT